jgi:hypothetical protein
MNINVARENRCCPARKLVPRSTPPIFNFIFSSRQAYTQIGLFLGALVCVGLGGLILGNSLYWRVHALRASGVIIGVTAKNGMYAPVYRYTLPDGQTHEAQSDTSSGATRGTETG